MTRSSLADGRRAKLKDDLTAAAEHLIETRGLAGVKARPLAQASGCALGAIYNVFPDLDTLIMAVSARTLERLDAHLTAVLAEAGGWEADPRAAARHELVALAIGYLAFASAHRARWRALFEHRLPEGKTIPDWLVADQSRLFSRLETLLAPLFPLLSPEARALRSRSLFSAVHGLVLLGLEEKLAAMPAESLRAELVLLVRAMVAGLET